MGDISPRRWRGRGFGLRIELKAGLWSLGFSYGVDVAGYKMDFAEIYALDLVMLA